MGNIVKGIININYKIRVLLFAHPLITTRTPPNYYTYTPYLIWFRRSLIKLDIASLS